MNGNGYKMKHNRMDMVTNIIDKTITYGYVNLDKLYEKMFVEKDNYKYLKENQDIYKTLLLDMFVKSLGLRYELYIKDLSNYNEDKDTSTIDLPLSKWELMVKQSKKKSKNNG